MKTIIYNNCQEQFSGEMSEETMKNMMPHYQEIQKDVMEAGGKEKRKGWMVAFHRRWEESSEA